MKKNKDENVLFGKRLQHFRKLEGLTVTRISKEVGVASSTYREWEYGRAITGLPYPKLALALNVDLYELFGIESTNTGKQSIKAVIIHKLLTARRLLDEALTEL